MNVFLIGLPGVGKSTVGKRLARTMKLRFIDADRVLEERCGADIPWIFDLEGEYGLRKYEQKLILELTQMNGIVLATGGGVVMTAENRTNLAIHGHVIYLKSAPERLVKRMDHEQRRPELLNPKTRLDVLQEMARVREPLYRSTADYMVDTQHKSVQHIVSEIVDYLEGVAYSGRV